MWSKCSSESERRSCVCAVVHGGVAGALIPCIIASKYDR